MDSKDGPMNVGRFLPIGISAALMLATGCSSHPAPTVAFEAPKAAVKPAEPPAAPAPVAAEDAVKITTPQLPDTLAQKTAEYARTLEPAVNAPGAVPTAAPSPVRWTDSAPHPRAAANSPVGLPVTPAAGATGSPAPAMSSTDATHVAVVTHSAQANELNDVPAIVPESSDFPAGQSAPDTLEAKLLKQVHDNPRDVAAQLDYELYSMLKDDSSPQLASLSMLPNEDKELVAALVDGVSNFRSAVRQDNNMLLSKKIMPILDMADRVRTEAELSLPTVALCKRVVGYGNYDPINPASFPAGQANPMIVYCEVANFASQMNDQQLWETRLRQEVTLFTETGLPVWHEKSREVVDDCRNRRHDFFVYDLVKLPANLSIGRYVLKITVEDRTANRVREATVPLEIVADTNGL
jgi:hypothetical protein